MHALLRYLAGNKIDSEKRIRNRTDICKFYHFMNHTSKIGQGYSDEEFVTSQEAYEREIPVLFEMIEFIKYGDRFSISLSEIKGEVFLRTDLLTRQVCVVAILQMLEYIEFMDSETVCELLHYVIDNGDFHDIATFFEHTYYSPYTCDVYTMYEEDLESEEIHKDDFY
ncbi:hypothetical protein TetV_009 [Tetraselmis virus 1]|uniref:Uncharacterized protein n=1 Tax=Tetraselmis virus 1 TaxID=2060617 RepID=A0A2P0VMI0_9VIRU|nr:hypothetical protein QJ968_gp009 [Tetraselmis virus 1]AUF82101.1 hypothetical protein TetV_009 [Tetraselmis virus 1]